MSQRITRPLPHERCSCGASMFCTALTIAGREVERTSFREVHAPCRERDGDSKRVIDRLSDFIEEQIEGSHVYRDTGLVVT